MRLQCAPKAVPAKMDAGNSIGKEAKALKQTVRAERKLTRTMKMQRGVPLECRNLSGTYLHHRIALHSSRGHDRINHSVDNANNDSNASCR